VELAAGVVCSMSSQVAPCRRTLGEVVHTATCGERMFHVEPRDVTALAHGDRQSDASLLRVRHPAQRPRPGSGTTALPRNPAVEIQLVTSSRVPPRQFVPFPPGLGSRFGSPTERVIGQLIPGVDREPANRARRRTVSRLLGSGDCLGPPVCALSGAAQCSACAGLAARACRPKSRRRVRAIPPPRRGLVGDCGLRRPQAIKWCLMTAHQHPGPLRVPRGTSRPQCACLMRIADRAIRTLRPQGPRPSAAYYKRLASELL
jgi:hypothetical protein